MSSLEEDILAALPAGDNDMRIAEIHEKVNEGRAERSVLRYAKLGFLVGVSRRRLQHALDALLADGKIQQDTRNAAIHVMGVLSLEQTPHYRKAPERNATGSDQSQ